MKRFLLIIITTILSFGIGHAQKITDSGYRTVGFIKTDGTVQDSGYRTIDHAGGLPMEWAALFFFFRT